MWRLVQSVNRVPPSPWNGVRPRPVLTGYWADDGKVVSVLPDESYLASEGILPNLIASFQEPGATPAEVSFSPQLSPIDGMAWWRSEGGLAVYRSAGTWVLAAGLPAGMRPVERSYDDEGTTRWDGDRWWVIPTFPGLSGTAVTASPRGVARDETATVTVRVAEWPRWTSGTLAGRYVTAIPGGGYVSVGTPTWQVTGTDMTVWCSCDKANGQFYYRGYFTATWDGVRYVTEATPSGWYRCDTAPNANPSTSRTFEHWTEVGGVATHDPEGDVTFSPLGIMADRPAFQETGAAHLGRIVTWH